MAPKSCMNRTRETTGTQKLRKLLEKVFASRAQTRVVQHFLDRPKEFFNLSRIAKETGLAHSTIHRVMQPLVDMGLVKEIKVGQQIRLFILETEEVKSKILADFYTQIKPHLEDGPKEV